MSHLLQIMLGILQEFARVLRSDFGEDASGRFHIALVRDGQHDFVPDKGEVLGVVQYRRPENHGIGNQQNAAAVLISAYPRANLEQTSVEESNVDYIACHFLKLDAIAGGVHMAGENGEAPGDAEQWLFKCDGETGADEPDHRSLVLERVGPQDDDDDSSSKGNDGGKELASAILLPVVMGGVVNISGSCEVQPEGNHNGDDRSNDGYRIGQPVWHRVLDGRGMSVVALLAEFHDAFFLGYGIVRFCRIKSDICSLA